MLCGSASSQRTQSLCVLLSCLCPRRPRVGTGRPTAAPRCPRACPWSRARAQRRACSPHCPTLTPPSARWRATWGPGSCVTSSWWRESAGYRHTGRKERLRICSPNGLFLEVGGVLKIKKKRRQCVCLVYAFLKGKVTQIVTNVSVQNTFSAFDPTIWGGSEQQRCRDQGSLRVLLNVLVLFLWFFSRHVTPLP